VGTNPVAIFLGLTGLVLLLWTARTAMSGLMTYLMEERLRSLQPDCDGSDAMEEIIEIVRDYLT
jgi:hypothetical protein